MEGKRRPRKPRAPAATGPSSVSPSVSSAQERDGPRETRGGYADSLPQPPAPLLYPSGGTATPPMAVKRIKSTESYATSSSSQSRDAHTESSVFTDTQTPAPLDPSARPPRRTVRRRSARIAGATRRVAENRTDGPADRPTDGPADGPIDGSADGSTDRPAQPLVPTTGETRTRVGGAAPRAETLGNRTAGPVAAVAPAYSWVEPTDAQATQRWSTPPRTPRTDRDEEAFRHLGARALPIATYGDSMAADPGFETPTFTPSEDTDPFYRGGTGASEDWVRAYGGGSAAPSGEGKWTASDREVVGADSLLASFDSSAVLPLRPEAKTAYFPSGAAMHMHSIRDVGLYMAEEEKEEDGEDEKASSRAEGAVEDVLSFAETSRTEAPVATVSSPSPVTRLRSLAYGAMGSRSYGYTLGPPGYMDSSFLPEPQGPVTSVQTRPDGRAVSSSGGPSTAGAGTAYGPGTTMAPQGRRATGNRVQAAGTGGSASVGVGSTGSAGARAAAGASPAAGAGGGAGTGAGAGAGTGAKSVLDKGTLPGMSGGKVLGTLQAPRTQQPRTVPTSKAPHAQVPGPTHPAPEAKAPGSPHPSKPGPSDKPVDVLLFAQRLLTQVTQNPKVSWDEDEMRRVIQAAHPTKLLKAGEAMLEPLERGGTPGFVAARLLNWCFHVFVAVKLPTEARARVAALHRAFVRRTGLLRCCQESSIECLGVPVSVGTGEQTLVHPHRKAVAPVLLAWQADANIPAYSSFFSALDARAHRAFKEASVRMIGTAQLPRHEVRFDSSGRAHWAARRGAAIVESGRYIFVWDDTRTRLRICKPVPREQHHTTISGGQAVACAGELDIDGQGRPVSLTNGSGHYLTTRAHLDRFVLWLGGPEQLGARAEALKISLVKSV